MSTINWEKNARLYKYTIPLPPHTHQGQQEIEFPFYPLLKILRIASLEIYHIN